MTNTVTQSLGWEIAGGKKAAKKIEVRLKTKDVPKIEQAPPISTSTTIYDFIRESDESGDEMNNNKKTKQVKQTAPVVEKIESPKKQTRKEPKESLNLLNSSIAANKKKTEQKQPKNPEIELDNALKSLRLEDLEKELTQLTALFSNNSLVINQNLFAFLNKQLDSVPDVDPSHENETIYPMAKLDKNVLKFLNGTLSKLNRQDAEKFFDFCLGGLFMDSQKVPSNHGHKIGFQLIAKLNPGLLVNLQKVNETINANKHRHQRLLIALWAMGQFGYYNLSNGIKVWFDCMLPQINTKGCNSYVLTYLSSLFQAHKVSSKSKIDVTLTLDQYTKLYDLVNDKSLNIPKDASQKLKSSFDVLRSLYLQEVPKQNQNFENLLKNLPLEKSSKQSDLLEFLLESLFKNKDSLSKWKQSFVHYMPQSLILLEQIHSKYMKNFKQLKDARESMKYFDEHTSVMLTRLNSKDAKTNHYTRSKSNKSQNDDVLKSFNQLAKKINNEHYKQISFGSMVFKTLFYTVLAVSLFFYWDSNYNKSVYTNSAKQELEKYGLLDHTLRLVESIQRLFLSIKKTLNYYIPIYQRKFQENVVPVLQNGWKTTKVYTNLVIVKSQPYVDTVVEYTNQGLDYVHKNYPVLVKNLNSCIQLAVNYVTTVSDFVFQYVLKVVEFVGVRLFGLKSGELERIFLDGFIFVLDKLTEVFVKITEYFNKL